ncbi:macrophage-expressed gene 1 protein [Danio aesculapii]|uniref:macrophage-expressed gene 1 protein n=1 Tax=Danio aesculapii TaxID=1142201 RepID=UPI0024C00DDA|nr:macrophage-expressed gene 1 protein [Danio aesculapii]
MESRAFTVLMLLCFINVNDLHPLVHLCNGLHLCHKNASLTALDVLPGGGWDNLRNIDMGRVMNLSYSHCQTTEDGVYLIPDEVFVIPQKESTVETNSEIIRSWMNHTSSTSSSINADASFLSVLNGKFSEEYQHMKTRQVKDNSVTSRVQVRNHLYTLKAYPDFTLDSRFAQQAVEIAHAIENNQTRLEMYLSEKLVLKYGTHVITSIDAGATLVQEDYLKRSYVPDTQSDLSSLSAAAGLKFFDNLKFDVGGKGSQDNTAVQEYERNIAHSVMLSHGGALFYPGITLPKWQENTLNNLVAIDRSGLPLHYFLNPLTFSDLPTQTVKKLASSVHQAIERYYKVNAVPGCVNVDSPYFNFQANVDDASCEGPITNLSFGGIYQRCTPLTSDGDAICEETAQKNPATGGYSCPQHYNNTLLHSEIVESQYKESSTHTEDCGFFKWFTCPHQKSDYIPHVRRAKVDTYWCSTFQKTLEYSGYLFGGLYGPDLQNPLTKSNNCPPDYFTLKFLSNGMMICLSNDYEAGTRFSVPFGGFFSCTFGNPVANNQFRCPPQFSQHLAAISDGCQVLYCVQSGVFTGGLLKPVLLPPYKKPPVISISATKK